MAFESTSVRDGELNAWYSIATQQAAKLLSKLPLSNLSNIPYAGRLVSVVHSMAQTNGYILFGSTFIAENLLRYAKTRKKSSSILKDGTMYQIGVQASFNALTAAVVRIATNRATTGAFSTASVVPTMLVAAFSPLTSYAFSHLHTKIASGVNYFSQPNKSSSEELNSEE